MKITIEIREEGEGVFVVAAHCKKQKDADASADLRRYAAMVVAAIRLALPVVSKEFARKKATEEVGAWLMEGKPKGKKKRNVKSMSV